MPVSIVQKNPVESCFACRSLTTANTMLHLVAVGACYLDTVLEYHGRLIERSEGSQEVLCLLQYNSDHANHNAISVPRFVQEDEKLRATQLGRRRGGNCANTIEVLQQLVSESSIAESTTATTPAAANSGQDEVSQGGDCQSSRDDQSTRRRVKSRLISVLPRRDSAAVKLIAESLGCDPSRIAAGGHACHGSVGSGEVGKLSDFSGGNDISLDHCVYRPSHDEPASSYIIRSGETGSRTIVNYNDLPEMTAEEFKMVADDIVRAAEIEAATSKTGEEGEGVWFHFEGRMPEVTLECMKYIRSTYPSAGVSVEIEKPGRRGLLGLVVEADVVFYSRGWALGQGYKDYEECLREQSKLAPHAKLLCCTWGQSGAAAIQPGMETYAHRHAWASDEPCTVDTIGAGDTFTAGMLYACMTHDEDWDLGKKLEFANELAGRKVVQEGFQDLGRVMRPWL